jgi:hypothetical protein
LSILANDRKLDALAESMYAAINNKKLGSILKTSSDLSRIMQLDINGPGNTANPKFTSFPWPLTIACAAVLEISFYRLRMPPTPMVPRNIV